MKTITLVTTILVALSISCSVQKNDIQVWSSLPDTDALLVESFLSFDNDNDSTITDTVMIYPDRIRQEMDGVGAALTHSSAIVFNRNLSPTRRDSLFRVLFTPEGIGINYTRLCIGASDFAPDIFSYSEEEDFTLSNFSIDRDREDVIPMLKEILAINPGLKIMASPWSPPAWMKTNGSMIGGKLRPDCYAVYAEYLIKYIQAYAAEGITIHSLTVQNEPEYSTAAYPCMEMTAEEQKIFIRDYLGPKMQALGLKTEIVLFDHNCDNPGYPIYILNDSIARKFVAGSGFHLYRGEITAMCEVKEAHPDKELYFTEQSGGGWAPDFDQNVRWYTGVLFAGAMNCWSRNVLLWNLALDENDGPKNFGCQNCWGVVRITSDGKITHNAEYYAIAHYGKAVQPGARRLESKADGLSGVAFKNPNGTTVYLAVHNGKTNRTYVITDGVKRFNYTFKPGEVVTFRF